VSPPVKDSSFETDYPSIFEHLTCEAYQDGEVRETSTFTVFCKCGLFKVSLADRNNKDVTFASGETLKGALEQLELSLSSGKADWLQRSDRQPRR